MASPLEALRGVLTGLWSRFGGLGLSRFRLLLPGARFDYEREAGDFWSNSIVAIALKWLGDRYARPLIRVSKIAADGDYEPIGDNDLTRLWNKPNDYYGRRTMEKAIGLSLSCDGNAYIYKARSRSGRVVQLWYIPHDRCLPMWPADGSEFISGYKLRVDGRYYDLPKADVIHIRDGIDPRNERLGLAPLKAQSREMVTVNEESGFNASLLRNSGVPGLMIVPDDDKLRPNQEDADRIRERIRDSFTGDSRGDSIILGGRYKVVTVGYSPEQLRIDKLPANAQARLAAAAGVAPMSMGLPDPQKTYANLTEANRASWGTIQANQEIVAEALRWQLVSEFYDPQQYILEYVYDHIPELQEDLKTKSERVRGEWKDGLRKLNEAREELALEPDAEGDRYFPGTESAPEPELPEPGAEPTPGAQEPPAQGPDEATEQEVLKTALGLMRSIKAQLNEGGDSYDTGNGCDHCGPGHAAA